LKEIFRHEKFLSRGQKKTEEGSEHHLKKKIFALPNNRGIRGRDDRQSKRTAEKRTPVRRSKKGSSYTLPRAVARDLRG